MSAGGSRLAFIDALKALASQLIVLHHLAFYGPMSDYALSLSPNLISWFYDYARIAVQAFLVIGGFLAAQALARDGQLVDKPVSGLLLRRYFKLAPPYLAALLLAIAAAAVASRLMVNDAIPETPTLAQLVAHVFLLQSVLGFDGLSAGVWYIAIDFQLYTLLLVSLWLAARALPGSPTAGRVLVIALTLASLYYFNRDAGWDNWAIYFFGAYGLGAVTYWGVRRNTVSPWLLLIAALAIASLLLDYRTRIAVALVVGTALGFARHTGRIESWPQSKTFAWLGQISYAVFLVHYPICLVINTLFESFAPHEPIIQLGGIAVAWFTSIAGGALFYYQVECRAQRLLSGKTRATGATL